jgi:lipoate-protein ligase A
MDGPANMARDEALLMSVGRGESPPTLRFYRWAPATISLGYFQEYSDYERLPPPAGTLPVVRRQTGGGAILHDLELTYSIALPLSHPIVAGGRCNFLYDHVHEAFAAVLTRHGVPVSRGDGAGSAASHRGPFFCFERHADFDLLADGRKLLGSAQRRTAAAVLQHGSLILDCRYDQWICATVRQYAPGFCIEEHLVHLARTIAGEPVERGSCTARELTLADGLRFKYTGPEWTRKR